MWNLGRGNQVNLTYRKATKDDLDILTETRVKVLRAANNLSGEADMSEVKEQSYHYYKSAFDTDKHVAFLIFDGEVFVGAGGVSFFRVMPTCCNPTGKKAYIMNMYTNPDYRRKGIAFKTLNMLVDEAKSRGITDISLEATQMGHPLYEKFGFVAMSDEMRLPCN